MSASQPAFAQYFPTTAWFQRYGQRLDASDEVTATTTDWEGGTRLQITAIPVQEHTIGDLPSALVTLVEDTLDWVSDPRLAEIIAAAPKEIRSDIAFRAGPRRERILTALLDIPLCATTDRLWPALTVDLPAVVVSVLDQIAAIVANGGIIDVFLALSDGRCRSVDVLDGREDRLHGIGLTGEYAHWKSLVAGETTLMTQLLAEQLVVTGDMQTFLQYADAVGALIDIATAIATRFLF